MRKLPPIYNPSIHHRRSIRLKGYDYSLVGLYFVTICCEDRICRFGKVQNQQMILNDFGKVAHNQWAKLPNRFPNFELDVFQIMPNHMHGIIVLTNPDDVGAGFTPAQNDTVRAGFTPAPNDTVRAGFTPAQNDTVRAGFTPAPNDTVKAGFTPAQNDTVRAGFTPAPNDTVRAGFTPAPNNETPNTQRATARVAPTISQIIGAYKSLVANGCVNLHKSKLNMDNLLPHQIPSFGKLWQRNYYEHIIRNEKSYQTISNYIINNPLKWAADKFYKE